MVADTVPVSVPDVAVMDCGVFVLPTVQVGSVARPLEFVTADAVDDPPKEPPPAAITKFTVCDGTPKPLESATFTETAPAVLPASTD